MESAGMSFFEKPMTAGPRDPVVGYDELGRPVYETIDGTRYGAAFAGLEPERLPPVQGPRQDMARGDRARRRDIPAGSGVDFGAIAAQIMQGILQGFTAPGRALQGEPVTYGDVAATALDFGVMGAPMRAPQGALRAGGMRKNEGFTAYHGSPHDFDRFSMDKIGTGEGAQAYGHGLYFAESEGVARSYRDALAQVTNVNGVPLDELAADARSVATPLGDWGTYNLRTIKPGQASDESIVAAYIGDFVDPQKAIEHMWEDDQVGAAELAQRWMREGKLKERGSMYEVRINANPDDFLDWDAPLSEQPKNARAALRGFLDPKYGDGFFDEFADAGNDLNDIHKNFDDTTPEQLTQALSGQDIPGIKYRDAGSRGLDGAEGTRNFVVFDENLIEIVRKYGIAGAAAMLGMSQADVAEAMEQSRDEQSRAVSGILAEAFKE
jgi:hypothetical protein